MAKVTTGVSLDEEVMEGVRKLAEKSSRNLSNYINWVLKRHLEEESKKLIRRAG